MQIVYSTGIVNSPFSQILTQFSVANHRQSPSNQPNRNGSSRVQNQARRTTNSNSPCNRSIQYIIHIELLSDEYRHKERSYTATRQTQNRIDDSDHPLVVSVSLHPSRVETGPEQPQEQCPYHPKNTANIVRFRHLLPNLLPYPQHSTARQSTIRPKSMDVHRSPHIIHIDGPTKDDGLVQRITDSLNYSQYQQFQWAYPANQSSERDQNSGYTEASLDEGYHIHFDVLGGELVVEHFVPETIQQDVQLEDYCVDEEGETQCCPSLRLDEGHEVPEPYQHHNIDILEPRIELVQVFPISNRCSPHKEPIHEQNQQLQNHEGHSEHSQLSVIF